MASGRLGTTVLETWKNKSKMGFKYISKSSIPSAMILLSHFTDPFIIQCFSGVLSESKWNWHIVIIPLVYRFSLLVYFFSSRKWFCWRSKLLLWSSPPSPLWSASWHWYCTCYSVHCYSPQIGCVVRPWNQFRSDSLVRIFHECSYASHFFSVSGIDAHCLEKEPGNHSFKDSKCFIFCNAMEPPVAAPFCCYRTNTTHILVVHGHHSCAK